jgi:hypothetical protein
MAIRVSMADVIADVLCTLPAKLIAAKARASVRTVEGWKQRRSVPKGEHVLAMLSDDDLCALLLAPVNPEVAHQAKVVAAKKRLKELEAGE